MDRQERLEKNQERFHRANDRLAELVEDRASEDTQIPFLCECSDDYCRESVPLTIREYEELHEGSDRYVMLRGHLMTENERVVDERGDLLVTEKG